MNWIDLRDIEQKIVEKRYSDKEAFNYFLGIGIVYTLGYFLFIEEFKNIYKLAVIPALVITIVGSLQAFKVYTKNKGSNFFKDYFALSWVIGWRIFFYGIELLIGLIVVSSLLATSVNFETFDPPENNFFLIIFALIMGVWYYVLLYRSFKRVSLGLPYKTMNV